MLLVINCGHKLINICLFLVDVDLVVVLVVDDVLILHELVFFEEFSLEAMEQSVVDAFEIADVLAVVCERNLFTDDREMGAGCDA